uniref:NAD(P)H oxidoreductase RTN4IP1, mitochondrial n=1 Tax=Esox lucius TaxID=8010 RepID=A0A6Q2WU18_ESOLU
FREIRSCILGRALSSSGHTILMGRLKGSLSAFSRLQSNMSAWVIDEYGNNGVLRFTEEATAPSISSGDDVLIRVHAASLNPIDIAMRAGYGSILLKLRRDLMSLGQNASEFPIILGRDVSGVVVDCGSGVTHFTPGDEVWAAVPPWKQGSLAELVSLSEYEVSHKPSSLSHTEAASVPYVASTALSALVNAGGLGRDNCADKRVLIIGASGGVGTFSIQLLKAWGAHVTVTCSHNAEGLVRGVGADDVVDYTAGDVAAELGRLEKFDVVLDNVGGGSEHWAPDLLKAWSGAKYVTLVTPLLANTDSMGLLEGGVRSGLALSQVAVKNMCNGVFYRWGFYAPDGPVLDDVSRLVDTGKILPVVEATFPFAQVPLAFQKLEGGHARGKTVISVNQEAQEGMAGTEGVEENTSEAGGDGAKELN